MSARENSQSPSRNLLRNGNGTSSPTPPTLSSSSTAGGITDSYNGLRSRAGGMNAEPRLHYVAREMAVPPGLSLVGGSMPGTHHRRRSSNSKHLEGGTPAAPQLLSSRVVAEDSGRYGFRQEEAEEKYNSALDNEVEMVAKMGIVPDAGDDAFYVQKKKEKFGKKDTPQMSPMDMEAQQEKDLRQEWFGYNKVTDVKAKNPQEFTMRKSRYLIYISFAALIVSGVNYFYWRFLNTKPDNPVWLWWFYYFYACEIGLFFFNLVGTCARFFPCERPHLVMDQIVRVEPAVANKARVAMLYPVTSELLSVVLKGLLGASCQRLWQSTCTKSETLRIIVLDEKARRSVFEILACMYELSKLVRCSTVKPILLADGVPSLTPRAFYEWAHLDGGFDKAHVYQSKEMNRAIAVVKYMDLLVIKEEGKHVEAEWSARYVSKNEIHLDDILGLSEYTITPGFVHYFDDDTNIPSMVYATRPEPGTPRVSPKAGNMNYAIFPPAEDRSQAPLIGDATIVVVNDARHQIQPEFLQRTCVYHFKLVDGTRHYEWSNNAFVQIPQRFLKVGDDNLGNLNPTQYDIMMLGKDGVGAVSSVGQGSVWRVDALTGMRPNGKYHTQPTIYGEIGHNLGFRSELLVEDTHTSIDMFKLGWTSCFVSEPGEILAICTYQPDTLEWRTKQLLRWHQGAAQLLFYKGPFYAWTFGNFHTMVFHRIFCFELTYYYLVGFPAYMLLWFPVIFGVTGRPPFDTNVGTFMIMFAPVVFTTYMPNLIAMRWRNVSGDALNNDERTFLATCYLFIYGFLNVGWTKLTFGNADAAWTLKAPVWPVTLCFVGQFVGIAGHLSRLYSKGFNEYSMYFFGGLVSSAYFIWALWPTCSLFMGWRIPTEGYVGRTLLYLGSCAFILFFTNINNWMAGNFLSPSQELKGY